MEFKINTKEKTIEITQQVTLGELYSTISDMLKNGEWEEYMLIIPVKVEVVEAEKNPIINPLWPNGRPVITYKE